MSFKTGPLALVVALALCAGCKSTKQDSAGLAHVDVRAQTPLQINRAVDRVFTNDGYRLVHSGPTSTIYEKKASAGTSIAYGNWLTPVTVRVRTSITPVGEGMFRLQCTAANVRDPGSTVEEEMQIRRKSGPFLKLLQEVQQDLELSAAGSK